MFNSKIKSSFDDAGVGANTIIGAGTVINGDIESKGDIRIDGILKGNLKGKVKILIGPEGMVEGNIEGVQADVLGRITGRVEVKELLQLRGKAIVDGDIYAGRLQVEPTATFNGRCHMGANVVELKTEVAAAVNH